MTVAAINEVNRIIVGRVVSHGLTFTPNEPLRTVHVESHSIVWPRVTNCPQTLSDELQAWDAASDEVWGALDSFGE